MPQTAAPRTKQKQYEYVFVSDIHLGMRHGGLDRVRRLIDSIETENLVIVGDFIDGQRMLLHGHKHLDAEATQSVLDALMAKVAGGTKVTLLPGNHDERLRTLERLPQVAAHGIKLQNEFRFNMPGTGTPAIATHGDTLEFFVLRTDHAPAWFMRRLDNAFTGAISASLKIERCLDRAVKVPVNAMSWLIRAVERMTGHTNYFQHAFEKFAEASEVGVAITGHTHRPDYRKTKNGLILINDGDQAENFTCVGLDHTGKIEMIRWHDYRRDLPVDDGHRAASLKEAFRHVTNALTADFKDIWPDSLPQAAKTILVGPISP